MSEINKIKPKYKVTVPQGMIKHYKACKKPLCLFCAQMDEVIMIWEDYGRDHWKKYEVISDG